MNRLMALFILGLIMNLSAKEYHVSVSGNDQNDGSESNPFRTITAAAAKAMPGDIITVHAGIYRERINPPRGGESHNMRIVYRAAAGETVEIKGSEVITGWQSIENGVWKVIIPNTFFKDYNPYKIHMTGDWLNEEGHWNHTGEVYLNDKFIGEIENGSFLISATPFCWSRLISAMLYF